jgi:hypothetical protein
MMADLDNSIGSGPGLGGVGFVVKVVAVTVALTGAGLLTLRAGAVVFQMLAPGDPGHAHEPTSDPPSSESEAPPAGPTAESPYDTTPFEIWAKPTRAARRAAPGPTSNDSSLTAELALLRAAHDATSPEAKLAALDEHLMTFPNGQLADERGLMRIETLCKIGRLDDARVIADDLRRRGASVGNRVHELCPALDQR